MFSGHEKIELGIINRKLYEKPSNIWKLNNALLRNLWVKTEIKREIWNILNWIKIKTQKLWDAAKAVLRGVCLAQNAYT